MSDECATTAIPDHVIVGVNGTEASLAALRWASAFALEVGIGVRPILAWRLPPWAVSPALPGAPLPPSPEWFDDVAKQQMSHIIDTISEAEFVSPAIARGRAGPALVEAITSSTHAIVVGCRHHGAVHDNVLGSVGQYAIKHAAVPVVVVPPGSANRYPPGKVVVGIDESDNARSALDWALKVTPTSTPIHAVHACSTLGRALAAPLTADLVIGLEEAAIELVADRVSEATKRAGQTSSNVERCVYNGDPRSVLDRAAAPTDLLVVGSRGTDGIAGLIMGSVASALTHQPRQTTVVVPAATRLGA